MRPLLFLPLLLASPLAAKEPLPRPKNDYQPPQQEESFVVVDASGPWLTGPLLSPSANTLAKGHINVEPYLYNNNNIGLYDNKWHRHSVSPTYHSVNVLVFFQVGLSSRVDMSIFPQGLYNWVGDEVESFRFGDLGMSLGWQLIPEKPHSPGLKFSLIQIFPTGNYQFLDPAKLGTDSSGGGSFASSFRLTISKLFRLEEGHFLASRFAVWSTVFTPVSVHGLNSYGGNTKTDGTVYPGTTFAGIAGLEYTITKHWAVALDVLATYSKKTVFHNHAKKTAPTSGPTLEISDDVFLSDLLTSVGNNKSSFSLSLAPAIEYNFSKMYGLLLGVWFSALGKNSVSFVNGVAALNIYM
ncbi:MAG: hypothetical protein JSR76_00675 [Verrucomicrobia bacterium]|nr:hypothetical protein [Verrucomicrobiota bacterium]